MPAGDGGRIDTSYYHFSAPTPFTFQTDDRGIYRIFGLPANRYYVYVGEAQDDNSARMQFNASYYPRTFYGNTTELNEAKPVEVTSGAETSGIDITVGSPVRTYKAAGRVLDENG